MFPRLSIQYRLPLLICVLLLVVIIAVSWTSYIGMKNSALEAGRQRLLTLTEQLSSMFQQSARTVRATMRTTSSHESIKNYLLPTSHKSVDSALKQLRILKVDSTVALVQLLNQSGTPVLSVGRNDAPIHFNIDSPIHVTSVNPEFTTIGKIYAEGDSMFYPIIVAVMDGNKNTLGHIVQWRKITASKKSIDALAQLIGTNAALYIGNYDGNFWTNLMKPVTMPDFEKTRDPGIVTYHRGQERMFASVRPVTTTSWQVLVEFPRHSIVAAANKFLFWMLGAGIFLLVAGIVLAWMMSRNITRPLQQLTSAASSIASGDLTTKVDVDRHDELGKLARAFNAMAVQIQNAQQGLENKVSERTSQLEAVNKELEAFSYSVSHDLRAPLRAVSGYANILKEDYGPNLDAEANRILNAILTNAHMMGQLIDDLISFSRISRKEVAHHPIDMKQLAETCVQEIRETNGSKQYDVQIGPLPACSGDQSMIKQVWLNLIGNAVKYSSREKSPRIEIGYKEDEKGHVYFVKDNGVGFDMQYAHKLFGVFQRLHSPEAFEGTGVGLALAKRIINKHSGDIWAEAAPGKGATFYICLPKNSMHE